MEVTEVSEWYEAQISEDARKHAQTMADHKRHMQQAEAAIGRLRPNLSAASKSDYMVWLRGFIKAGGAPTHAYDYPWERNNFGHRTWFTVVRDCTIPPLYGSSSLSLIVMPGVQINGGATAKELMGIGHNSVYWMDGFTHNSIVPIYSDTTL